MPSIRRGDSLVLGVAVLDEAAAARSAARARVMIAPRREGVVGVVVVAGVGIAVLFC